MTRKKYNIKQFTPFSNNIEAKTWIERNCNRCNYYDCYTKGLLKRGGKIALKRAKWIGIEEDKLGHICNNFTTEFPDCKQKEREDKFIFNSY